MALRLLSNIITNCFHVDDKFPIYAGQVLGKTTKGVRPADRHIHHYRDIVGFAAEDKANSECTIIAVDPLTQCCDEDEMYFVVPKHANYSFFKNRKYKIPVATIPSIFVTDRFTPVETKSCILDRDDEIVFHVGDLLTFGAGENAGNLVKLSDKQHATPIAEVVKIHHNGCLLTVQSFNIGCGLSFPIQ